MFVRTSAKTSLFLDSNAGAPLNPRVLPEVLKALLVFSEGEGPSQAPVLPDLALLANPSSIHAAGRHSKKILNSAREQVGASLGETDLERIVFTSSGTEANQLAVHSFLEISSRKGRRPRWILSAAEHDSLLSFVPEAQKMGADVHILPVLPSGLPDLSALEALGGTPADAATLISLVWVNNETGVITDVSAGAEAASRLGAQLHLDGAQAWGKMPINVKALPIHFLSLSGHKIGALSGTGVLWQRPGIAVHPSTPGKQERGRRGGTENVIGILSLGVAAADLKPAVYLEKVAPLRDYLENAIFQSIPGVRVNGQQAARVANTLNISFPGIEGEGIVMALDMAGYCVSAGSACSSGVLEPSHVLTAMGLGRQEAMSSLRVSLDPTALPSRAELDGFVGALAEIVGRCQKAYKSRLDGEYGVRREI